MLWLDPCMFAICCPYLFNLLNRYTNYLDLIGRLVLLIGLDVAHFLHDVHAFGDTSENRVLSIEPWLKGKQTKITFIVYISQNIRMKSYYPCSDLKDSN